MCGVHLRGASWQELLRSLVEGERDRDGEDWKGIRTIRQGGDDVRGFDAQGILGRL